MNLYSLAIVHLSYIVDEKTNFIIQPFICFNSFLCKNIIKLK